MSKPTAAEQAVLDAAALVFAEWIAKNKDKVVALSGGKK